MRSQPGLLRLAEQKPLATGSWKLVFQHPHDDALLVKVIRPDGRVLRSRSAWYKGMPRERDLLLFGRELHEFVVARANANGRPFPIPQILGLAETDLGLGLVVEKLTDGEGRPAPTLNTKLRGAGLTAEVETMLAALIADINDHRIVLSEFKASNIVCTKDEGGRERLVLVDGFGDSSLVPLHSLSRLANSHRNLRKYRQMIRRTRLDHPAR